MQRWLAWGLLLHGACMLGGAGICDAWSDWSPSPEPMFDGMVQALAAIQAASGALRLPMLGLGSISLLAGMWVWHRLRGWRWLAHAAVTVHLPLLLWCGWILEQPMAAVGMPRALIVAMQSITVISTLGMVGVGWVSVERAWRSVGGGTPFASVAPTPSKRHAP